MNNNLHCLTLLSIKVFMMSVTVNRCTIAAFESNMFKNFGQLNFSDDKTCNFYIVRFMNAKIYLLS